MCAFMRKDTVNGTCWIGFYQCSGSGSSGYIVYWPPGSGSIFLYYLPHIPIQICKKCANPYYFIKDSKNFIKSSIFNQFFMILYLLEKYVVIDHKNVHVGSGSGLLINWPTTPKFIIQGYESERNIYRSVTLIFSSLFWEHVKKSNSYQSRHSYRNSIIVDQDSSGSVDPYPGKPKWPLKKSSLWRSKKKCNSYF